MNDAHRVVVTGIGFVSSLGNDQQTVLERLKSGRTGIGIHPELAAVNAPAQLAGLIEGFSFPSEHTPTWVWPSHVAIPRQVLRSLPPHGVYAHVALHEALAQSGLSSDAIQSDETGLFTASVGSTQLTFRHAQRMLTDGIGRCNPFMLTASIAGTLNFNLAASLGIRGVSGGSVSGCASSAQALGQAFDQIRSGRQKRMIVVGAEDCDLFSILPFGSCHALTTSRDPAESPCAFDRRRDGFAASGGATALVMESGSAAHARDAEPLAEICGWGWTSDGYHSMMPEPHGDGIRRAMELALRDAGLRTGQIDYVNAHASSTQAGDKAEALALTRLFDGASPWISSTKSQTGHALSMAGILEAAISVLALRHGVVPGNVNLRDPDPAAASLRLPRESQPDRLQYVMSNSSGFGGVNVALIFGARTPAHPADVAR
jgi:3-oxoacyl-(acyl-carrier-protein) synthase